MNYKTSKILAIIVVSLLYAATLLITLSIVSAGILGLIGLIKAFNIRDLVISLMVVIFFYCIYKISWNIIQGMKTSGKEVNKTYDDLNVAKFEFECMQLNNISQYLVLYKTEGTGMEQLDLYINNKYNYSFIRGR